MVFNQWKEILCACINNFQFISTIQKIKMFLITAVPLWIQWKVSLIVQDNWHKMQIKFISEFMNVFWKVRKDDWMTELWHSATFQYIEWQFHFGIPFPCLIRLTPPLPLISHLRSIFYISLLKNTTTLSMQTSLKHKLWGFLQTINCFTSMLAKTEPEFPNYYNHDCRFLHV